MFSKFEYGLVEDYFANNPAEKACLQIEWETTKLDTIDYTKSRFIPTTDSFFQSLKDQQISKSSSIFTLKKISINGAAMKVSTALAFAITNIRRI